MSATSGPAGLVWAAGALLSLVSCAGPSSVTGGPAGGAASGHDEDEVPRVMGPELAVGRLDEVEVLPGECAAAPPVEVVADMVVHALDVDGDGDDEMLHVGPDLRLKVIDVDGDVEDPCLWGAVVHEVPLVTEPIASVYRPEALTDLPGEVVPQRVRMSVLPDGRSLRIDLAALPVEQGEGPETGAYGYYFMSFMVTFDEAPMTAAAAPVMGDASEFESVTFWTSRKPSTGELTAVKMSWSVASSLERLEALFERSGGSFQAALDETWTGWAQWIDRVVEGAPLDGEALDDLRRRLSGFMPTDRAPDLGEALKSLVLHTVELFIDGESYVAAHDLSLASGLLGHGFDDPELEKERVALVSALPSLLAGGWKASVEPVEGDVRVVETFWHLDGRLAFMQQGGDWGVWEQGTVRDLMGEELETFLHDARPDWKKSKFRWTVDFALATPGSSCPEGAPALFGRLDVCRRKAPSRCNSHVFLERPGVPFPWDDSDAPGGVETLDLVAFGIKNHLVVARRQLLVHLVLKPEPDKGPSGLDADPCGIDDVDTFESAETLNDLSGYLDFLTSSPYTADGLGYIYGADGGIWLGSFQVDVPDVLIVPMTQHVEHAVWSPDNARIAAVDVDGHLYVVTVARPGLTPVTLDESEID